ncbi:hypothetical protein [Pseudobutyrivibrio sp. LB2011]|nr:hypothetical protein [Pseudobutyrivibrio sp. LB2011]
MKSDEEVILHDIAEKYSRDNDKIQFYGWDDYTYFQNVKNIIWRKIK